MQKVFFLLFLLVFNLFASSISAEQKIYASVISVLYGQSTAKVLVWTDDKEKEKLFSHIERADLISNMDDADILFVFHTTHIKSKKPIFVGSYSLLKHYKKEAIGGFYWQKGRPNLLFLRSNLKRKKLQLDRSLSKYVEDSF